MKIIQKNKTSCQNKFTKTVTKKIRISLDTIKIEIPEMIQSLYKHECLIITVDINNIH